ncbi:hypothetical protein ABE426_14430 [Sphingobacterium faecium]|uniref:hypothetical protein n=1 Tax=Sphingobacterium faecium TaxID=34087 RepID=UPI003209090F
MAEEKDNNVWPSGYSEAKTIDEFDYLMTGKNGAPLTKFNKDKYKQYLSTTGQRMKAVSSGVLPAGPADKEMYMVLESSGTWTFGGNTFVNVEYQILTLWWNKNTWSVENIHLLPRGKDGRDIMDWEAKPYAFSSSVPKVSFLVFKDGIIWENNAATVAGDVPGISPKWILKTGVSIATSISSNGKNPISQEGVYKFVNGAKEFVFGSDLNKYDKIYSSNPVTVVMDYIYQEDTYTNPIYIKALVEGNISIKVFNNVNGLLTVVYDFIYSLISGVNIVNLDFPMKKGYMIGASWNNTTKTGRIAGSATDVNSKFYAISNEPTSTTISTIVSDFGIGMDFVAQKKGLPIIGKIRHSIFKSFITGSGNLLPDYTSNPDYLTLTFTSGDQRVNATGNYSPNGKSSILKFRVKSSIDNTILTVGRFASAGIPPLTYHVNVGTVEKYFELEILGNVADNISIGIVSAKNVGQVVQLKVLEIDEIKNTEDLVKDIQPQQESYAITSSVRYPLLGTSIATSGYLSTVKMPMDIGDIGEYGINVAPTASASEVFQVLFEPESGLARSPIVFERNNLNSFVEGKYKATEKGYLIVTNIRAVESQIRTAYARIVKHSKILTSNDLNIDIVTKDQYKKSSLHNLNIGFTYLIDAHFNYPNDNYNRFDHVNILPFNGELVAICQRFGNNGGDYAFSQIVVYSSSDLGASWRFLAAKPVTSANAEANPVSVLNNDGTIEIFLS